VTDAFQDQSAARVESRASRLAREMRRAATVAQSAGMGDLAAQMRGEAANLDALALQGQDIGRDRETEERRRYGLEVR
jgi:hypothetical protein